MKILFPTELEAAPFRALCPDATVEICGVGMAQTAVCVARLLGKGERKFILAGIAGAYSEEFEKGDVVAVGEERMAGIPPQFDRTYSASLRLEGLREVRGNTVCRCGAEACGTEIENMEGAALFALCEAFGAECAEVRAISNYVGEAREGWEISRALERLAQTLKNLKTENL